MKNLFDYAFKELTNTAVWAWILANEGSDDQELSDVSRTLRCRLGVPENARFLHVASNQNIDAGNQIDILATYESGNEKVFVLIENKTGKDDNVLVQTKRYISKLRDCGAQHIIPFIFTFDVDIKRESFQEDGISIMTIMDMQRIFGADSYKNIILNQYASFLKKKLFILLEMSKNKGNKNGEMSYEYWQGIASHRGVEDLLFFYVEKSGRLRSSETRFNKNNSVHLQFRREGALISARPKELNIVKGLKIGYSVKNLGYRLDANYLPAEFEDEFFPQGTNEWRFGFFDNRGSIDRFLSFFEKL